MSAHLNKTSARLIELDIAKGMGIFLVVLGHIVSNIPPKDVIWYPVLKKEIYLFHMPFFMFVSGAIAGYTWKPVEGLSHYFRFIGKKASRLLPAYLLFSVIVFAIKYAAMRLGKDMDNPVRSIWDFFNVLLYPLDSFSRFLWYILILFILYALLPLLLAMTKNRPLPLLLFAATIQFFPSTELFGIVSVKEYLFVFLLGFFFMRPSKTGESPSTVIIPHLRKFWPAYTLVLLIFVVWIQPGVFGNKLNLGMTAHFNSNKILCGLLSIPALMGMACSDSFKRSNTLLAFGKYTFVIYLMNTMAIGFAKSITQKIAPWDGNNFFWVAPVLLLAGLYLPILVKKHIFRRFRYLDKITE